jgi:hypothetical protein
VTSSSKNLWLSTNFLLEISRLFYIWFLYKLHCIFLYWGYSFQVLILLHGKRGSLLYQSWCKIKSSRFERNVMVQISIKNLSGINFWELWNAGKTRSNYPYEYQYLWNKNMKNKMNKKNKISEMKLLFNRFELLILCLDCVMIKKLKIK